MSAGSAFIEHKPELKWPWQVRIINRAGKSVMLYGCKTQAAAETKLARIKRTGKPKPVSDAYYREWSDDQIVVRIGQLKVLQKNIPGEIARLETALAERRGEA